jgi:hypothetical protein
MSGIVNNLSRWLGLVKGKTISAGPDADPPDPTTTATNAASGRPPDPGGTPALAVSGQPDACDRGGEVSMKFGFDCRALCGDVTSEGKKTNDGKFITELAMDWITGVRNADGTMTFTAPEIIGRAGRRYWPLWYCQPNSTSTPVAIKRGVAFTAPRKDTLRFHYWPEA